MTSLRRDDPNTIPSSSSSENSPLGWARPNERLIDLLTRPRAHGGYGGRLSYAGFATLAASLGWNQEDIDDCWYDIVMGEPCAEAVDMARVAECVCSYCLASPLPMLERCTTVESIPAEPATPPRQVSLSTDRNTTVLLSPPTPPSRMAEAVALATLEKDKKERARTETKPPNLQTLSQRRRSLLNAFPRYAVETVSSEHRKTCVSPCHQSHKVQSERAATHSPRRASAAPATPRTSGASGSTVFLRLYEKGMEQHQKRTSARPADETAAECTFQPHITPYTTKAPDTRDVQYNRPTKSYFAKLTAQEAQQDLLHATPETPRVTYHPAPGPSSSVPTGYVEGVARLRSYIASRYTRRSFEGSLRASTSTDVARLMEAPILRLPITVGGVMDSVDVRLAPSDTRTSLGQRHNEGREHLSSRQPTGVRHASLLSPSRMRFEY
ncbi:hypothetical protein, conserved [Leishmania shawi]|uniref:Uncharacterized protein n=1 Tax=Leishmania shawi TaxID=5680 RepID=A0ABR3E849_9TRYP